MARARMVLPNAGSILGYLMLGSLVFLGDKARRGGLASSLAIAMGPRVAAPFPPALGQAAARRGGPVAGVLGRGQRAQ